MAMLIQVVIITRKYYTLHIAILSTHTKQQYVETKGWYTVVTYCILLPYCWITNSQIVATVCQIFSKPFVEKANMH